MSVGARVVGVGARASTDEPVGSESGEVVAGLVDGVGDAEQMAHLGAQAPVGESEGVQADTQGAEQGHDPRISEPQCGRPPAILGEGGLRDPLKGWARKDTTLPDPLSIEQAALTARDLAWSSSRCWRRRLQIRSRGSLITVSIRSARPSLRYCF